MSHLHLVIVNIARIFRLILVSIYPWCLLVVMGALALAFVPPLISCNLNFVVIIVIVGVPLYSSPEAPLPHVSIAKHIASPITNLSGKDLTCVRMKRMFLRPDMLLYVSFHYLLDKASKDEVSAFVIIFRNSFPTLVC